MPNHYEKDYLDLSLLIQLIKKQRVKILIGGLLFVMIGMIYALTLPKQYQARVLIKLENKQVNSFGKTNNILDDPIPVQIALLRSDFILQPVIQSLNLAKQANEFIVLKKLRSKLSVTDLSSSADNMANKVAILQLAYTAKNPNLAMTVVNKIAEIAQQQNIKLKTAAAEKTLTFLMHQLPLIQKSLQAAEAKLNQYRAKNGRINIKLQTQNLLSHISHIDEQMEKIQLRKTNLLQQYTVFHPFVIALNQEQKALMKQRQTLVQQLKTLPAADQKDVNLTRDVQIKNNLYMILLNQIHQYQVMRAGINSDLQIIYLAKKAEELLPVKLTVIALISFIIGVIVVTLGIFCWIIMNKHKKSVKLDIVVPAKGF